MTPALSVESQVRKAPSLAQEPPTTAELRAAFNRAALLHLRGWTFARALTVPYVAWSLEKSALAARSTEKLPAQPRLI